MLATSLYCISIINKLTIDQFSQLRFNCSVSSCFYLLVLTSKSIMPIFIISDNFLLHLDTYNLQWSKLENWFCRPSENLENLYRAMEMRICNPEFNNQPQPCEGTRYPTATYCGILSCFDHSYHVWYYDIKCRLHWKTSIISPKTQKRTTKILGNYRNYGFQNLLAPMRRANKGNVVQTAV